MNNPICSTQFDSRDLVEYKEYIDQELLDAWNEWQEENLDNEYETDDIDEALQFMENLSDNGAEYFNDAWHIEIEEQKLISDFIEELDGYSLNFQYGEAIIHEDYFTDYTKDFVNSCGYIGSELPWWIENNIDWDGVAVEVKADYSEVIYQGDSYFIR